MPPFPVGNGTTDTTTAVGPQPGMTIASTTASVDSGWHSSDVR